MSCWRISRSAVITLAFFLPSLVAACNAIVGNAPVSLVAKGGSSGGGNGGVDVGGSAAGLVAGGNASIAGGGAGGSSGTESSLAGESSAGSSGCEEGQIRCGGACIPWNDPNNCGSCGNSCADGNCGVSIAANMQTQPSGWLFNGTAKWSGTGSGGAAGAAGDMGSAVLVAAHSIAAAGTVVYAHPVIAEDFTATFQFRIGLGGGSERSNGMGFMIETNGPTAVGQRSGGLGISGLTGYGVEFDIYNNNHCGDTNNDHVGIDLLTMCNPSLDTTPTSLYASQVTNFFDLADAQWHAATITLHAGAFSVSVDNNALANQGLVGWVPGTAYYYGFGAATGPNIGGYQAEVKDLNIAFPQPTCL